MRLDKQIEAKVKEVNEALRAYLPKEEGQQRTIFEAMNYSVWAGGKRLRPMFLQSVYEMFAGADEDAGAGADAGAADAGLRQGAGDMASSAVSGAMRDAGRYGGTQGDGWRGAPVPPGAVAPFVAAIEMIHTSSLIHDDLPCMDNDTLRRGLPTTWVKFGDDLGVLAGDALMLYAFEVAAKAFEAVGGPHTGKAAPSALHYARIGRAIGVLAQKSGIYGMVGGQTLDVELTGKPIWPEQLQFIYRLKTGALLEAAFVIGAILGGANEEQIHKIEQVAGNVGFAFQIQDDILDVEGDIKALGKPVLSDEKNQKSTYVTIYGMEAAKNEVARLSRLAMDTLRTLPGDPVFLAGLIEKLITRRF
ncbi:MAG: polyprenyl synthetase family protein [Lachnospiraceae bacterium]|jgi:geranylgeranyl diphosphate synthase type II|nr:polyprenyl synthetase family protein [Lachnospiraceae bacterium]